MKTMKRKEKYKLRSYYVFYTILWFLPLKQNTITCIIIHQCHLNHHQHHHCLTLCESTFIMHLSSRMCNSAKKKKKKKRTLWLLRTLKSSWLGHYFLGFWQLPAWSINPHQAKYASTEDTHTQGHGKSICVYVCVRWWRWGVRVQPRSQPSSSLSSLQPHESNVSDLFLFFLSTVCSSCVVKCLAAEVKWAESF